MGGREGVCLSVCRPAEPQIWRRREREDAHFRPKQMDGNGGGRKGVLFSPIVL